MILFHDLNELQKLPKRNVPYMKKSDFERHAELDILLKIDTPFLIYDLHKICVNLRTVSISSMIDNTVLYLPDPYIRKCSYFYYIPIYVKTIFCNSVLILYCGLTGWCLYIPKLGNTWNFETGRPFKKENITKQLIEKSLEQERKNPRVHLGLIETELEYVFSPNLNDLEEQIMEQILAIPYFYQKDESVQTPAFYMELYKLMSRFYWNYRSNDIYLKYLLCHTIETLNLDDNSKEGQRFQKIYQEYRAFLENDFDVLPSKRAIFKQQLDEILKGKKMI